MIPTEINMEDIFSPLNLNLTLILSWTFYTFPRYRLFDPLCVSCFCNLWRFTLNRLMKVGWRRMVVKAVKKVSKQQSIGISFRTRNRGTTGERETDANSWLENQVRRSDIVNCISSCCQHYFPQQCAVSSVVRSLT